jgi:CBS domain-containing protein
VEQVTPAREIQQNVSARQAELPVGGRLVKSLSRRGADGYDLDRREGTMEIRDFAKAVVTARPYDDLKRVAGLMEQHNVGSVIVVEKNRPVGIITDRDVALELGVRGTALHVPISRVMTAPVETVSWTANLVEVTESMRDLKVRRLVVVDDLGQVTGIVTLDDLLEVLAAAMSNVVQGIAPEMMVK